MVSSNIEKVLFQVKWERFWSAMLATKWMYSLSVRLMDDVDVKMCRCVVVYIWYDNKTKRNELIICGVTTSDSKTLKQK